MNSVLLGLADRSGQRKRTDGRNGWCALSLAQQVWGQIECAWERPFLEALARSYGTGVLGLDFARSAAATKAINDWVGRSHRGQDHRHRAAGRDRHQTRMAFANAIYLRAPWDEECTKVGRAVRDGRPARWRSK